MRKEEARIQMEKLVNDFKRFENECLKKTFKEASARKLYIDKFFEALGWNVSGEMGVAPESQDVLVEESLDSEGNNKKFVDYTFRILKTTKFMCEAKKPSESINNKSYIFQAKSYAFSQGIPFIILTNFYEMKLFDINTKPLKDKPEIDNIEMFNIKYTDYISKFDLLWDTFSRQAVENGSLVKLYVDRRGINEEEINSFGAHKYINIKGSAILDDEFLKDMQQWRSILAEDIYKNNKNLNIEEISEIVQLSLDRIIFTRILEDRGIEVKEILKDIILQYKDKKITSVKEELDKKYHELYAKYSGLLFDINKISDECIISNEVLCYIIENLYYDKSPYNFKYIRIEVLGNMFEQYLGSTLVEYDDTIKVELKPEYRKIGAAYYTPEYIAKEIVENTVIPSLNEMEYEQFTEFKLLDLTAGSGSMLVKAYKCIIDMHLERILNSEELKQKALDEHLVEIKNNRYKPTLKLKTQILKNNIFGVDVDSRAIEIIKMSFYIVLLEDEENYVSDNLLLLPDLNSNIKCGDSLVDNKYKLNYDNCSKINTFNWDRQFKEIKRNGGFNCIIGNPPYIKYQSLAEIYPNEIKKYWANKYKEVVYGNYDIYVLFIRQAMKLLSKNGKLGYIVSNKFFITTYGNGLRKLIAEEKSLSKIVYFGDVQIFKGATTYTTLLFLDRNNNKDSFEYIKVNNINNWLNNKEEIFEISKDSISNRKWLFTNPEITQVLKKLKQSGIELSSIVDRIFVGIQTNGDDIYMVSEVEDGESNSEYIHCYSKYTKKNHMFEKKHLKNVVKGSVDLKKYNISYERKMKLIFPYNIVDNKAILIDKEEYMSKYPYTWEYLNEVKNQLIKRTKSQGGKKVARTEQDWYGYIYPKNLSRYMNKKILVPSMSEGAAFSYDEDGKTYFIGSGTGGGGGYAITINENTSAYSYYSLLGILNSSVSNFLIMLMSDVYNNGYNGIKKEILNELIIPKIDLKNRNHTEILQKIEVITKMIINCKNNMKNEKSNRKISLLEQEYQDLLDSNDNLVYKLFNISQKEIDIIEQNMC